MLAINLAIDLPCYKRCQFMAMQVVYCLLCCLETTMELAAAATQVGWAVPPACFQAAQQAALLDEGPNSFGVGRRAKAH